MDCPSGSYNYGTGHSNDAGVRCQLNSESGSYAWVEPIHNCNRSQNSGTYFYSVQTSSSERFVLLEETVPVKGE